MKLTPYVFLSLFDIGVVKIMSTEPAFESVFRKYSELNTAMQPIKIKRHIAI